MAARGRSRRELRPAGQDDADPEPAGHEVDGRVVAAEPGDAVDVDGQRRAIGRCSVDERGEVGVADEYAGIQPGRCVHGMPAVARDEDGGKRGPGRSQLTPSAPEQLGAGRDAERASRQHRPDIRLGPDEAAGQDRDLERRQQADDRGQDDPGQDLDDVGRRAADRRGSGIELAAPHEEQPEDGGHALVADRRHQLAMRADDRVDAGVCEPADARSVGLEAGDQIDVDGDELAGVVDPANDLAEGQAVAAEDEDDGSPAGEGVTDVLLGGDRRAARIGCDTCDECLGVRRGVRHTALSSLRAS